MVSAGPDYTAQDVIALLEGEILSVFGDMRRSFRHPRSLSEADEQSLTFCRNPDSALSSCPAAVVITTTAAPDYKGGATLIRVAEPRLAFIRVLQSLFAPVRPSGIHPSAIIDSTAQIATDVYVGAHAVVGRCLIAAGCVIHAGVILYDNVRIGRNVTINSGTVIGADGFGYERNDAGEMEKFPHFGGVLIEDDVEIGSNTSIDRGTLGDTKLLQGAKIDNQVHIAHNVVVGRHAVVIAQAMIGGSVMIGDEAWIAPSACIRNGIRIGARATVGLGAVVVKDVPDGTTVMGSPARNAAEFKALTGLFNSMIRDGGRDSTL